MRVLLPLTKVLKKNGRVLTCRNCLWVYIPGMKITSTDGYCGVGRKYVSLSRCCYGHTGVDKKSLKLAKERMIQESKMTGYTPGWMTK